MCVSVPECMASPSRKLIRDACERVSRKVLGDTVTVELVNETLCVSIQYSTLPPLQPKRFLSVDFGASKLAVSAFDMVSVGSEGAFRLVEVVSLTDPMCSMSEIEWRIVQWCEKRKPFQNSMIASKSAVFKLRKEIRNALKTLTVAEEATIECDGVVGGHDLQLVLTLEDFEHECLDIFETVASLVKTAIDRAGGDPPCSECVIIGGGMRVRRVQKVLSGLLDPVGASVRKTLDMDRAVSMGASTVAAIMRGCSIAVPLDRSQNPHARKPKRERRGGGEGEG